MKVCDLLEWRASAGREVVVLRLQSYPDGRVAEGFCDDTISDREWVCERHAPLDCRSFKVTHG
jgi:hypothetical protein